MTKRKETSTNSLNRRILTEFCGVQYTLDLIEGRWKLIILYKLERNELRFTDLKKQLPNVTDRMLTKQLKELERDGLINRRLIAAVPVKVYTPLPKRGSRYRQSGKVLKRRD